MTIEHMRVCLSTAPDEDGIVFKTGKSDINGNPWYRVLWADGYDSGKFVESDWHTICVPPDGRAVWQECGILSEKELLVWMLKNPDFAAEKDLGDLD